MKKIISSMFLITLLLISLPTKSQNSGRFPLLRERITQAKLREIKMKLNLDPKLFEQFRPIYVRYSLELLDINFYKLGKFMTIETDSLSAEEADQLIVNQIEIAKKIISIREKYYKEFRTVLSPQQIVKLYQAEAEMRNKVQEEVKKRRMNP